MTSAHLFPARNIRTKIVLFRFIISFFSHIFCQTRPPLLFQQTTRDFALFNERSETNFYRVLKDEEFIFFCRHKLPYNFRLLATLLLISSDVKNKILTVTFVRRRFTNTISGEMGKDYFYSSLLR